MSRLAKSLFYTALLFAVAAQVAAQRSAPTPKDAFMPLSEIKAGMKGTSKTVFRGTAPEKFDVEILGVVPGMIGPQQDMIICRISGGEADRTAVFAGMSGSPVHIDGKLVGAIAFAFPFAKEPICGITPIEQTLGIFKGDDARTEVQPRSFALAELQAKDIREILPNGTVAEGVVNAGIGQGSPLAGIAGQRFRSISIPVSYAGVSERVLDMLSTDLAAFGLLPVATPGGSARMDGLKKASSDTLVGGSSVSFLLARGDFSMSASGTVTLRDGDNIYAFGHPFLSLGAVEMPMAESSVVTVVPNISNSFKLAVPGETFGAMTQDRATGVMGVLGKEARMIPVTVDFANSRGRTQTFRFETVRDEFLSPLLVNVGIINFAFANERNIGDVTVEMKGEIRLKGQQPIVIEKRFTGPTATQLASLAVAVPLNVILRSRFEGLEIEDIRFRMTSADGSRFASLERISTDRSEVRPGETFEVRAFVRGDGGRMFEQRMPVTVPVDAQAGVWNITVGDGGAIQQGSAVQQFTPRTLSELVSILNRAKKEDRLYVQVARQAPGAVTGSSEMPNLPPSVLATLNSGRAPGTFKPTTQQVIFEQEMNRSQFVVIGKQSIDVRVVR